MWNRRQFIKALGVLGGVVIAPFQWFGRAQASSLPDTPLPPGAELYEGFLLLPEGASVPAFVKPARLQPIGECGMVEGIVPPEQKVVIEYSDDLATAKDKVDIPLYTLSTLPHGTRQGRACIIRNGSGDVYRVSVHFEAHDSANDTWMPAVSLWIQPDFPQPFPLWSSGPVEPGGPFAALEKVDFLPSAGIKVVARAGFACYWIENDVLFTLIADPSPTGQEAESLVALLEAVS